MNEPAKDEAKLIEQVARAICCSNNCVGYNCKDCLIGMYEEILKDDIAAIRAAGWAVVPVEPTKEMLRAGYDESGGRAVIGIWEAMLETAPGVKP